MDVMMQREDLCRKLFRTFSTIRSLIYPPRTQTSPCGGELLVEGHAQSRRVRLCVTVSAGILVTTADKVPDCSQVCQAAAKYFTQARG